MRLRRLRFFLFLATAAGAVALAGIADATGLFRDQESATVDTRFSVRGDKRPPRDIVFVKVDDVTFSDLNARWPFRRTLHAALLDRIRRAHPKAVAFDVQFSEFTSPADDNELALAIQRAQRVVLATTEVAHGDPNLIWGPEGLRQMHARGGDSLVRSDPDGAIRHFQYDFDGLKSFALVVADLVTDQTTRAKTLTEGGQAWIDYAGPAGTITSFSYSRVLPERIVGPGAGTKSRGWKVDVPGAHVGLGIFDRRAKAAKFQRRYQIPLSAFRDKIVVVGASAPSLQDLHPSVFGPNMAGPEVQANMIETVLRGFPLRSAPSAENFVLLVLLALVPALVGFFAAPLVGLAAAVGCGALFTVGTQIAFNHGRVLSFVYPITALATSFVGSLGVHYVLAAFERERVRDVFSRFVPEQCVEEVLAQTDADLRLGGKEVIATAMFSDLRGFTPSAEQMPAAVVIQVLNRYLHEMSEAILNHGGTLVCYMGDGIFAVFGAPLEYDDHADRALAAAREMLTERLPSFNDWVRQQGLGDGYLMGIGLNSGPLMTGNVGHERRMDYTAVGDVTNTASRIEEMTKDTPFSVLLSDSTRQAIAEPPADLVFHDQLEVRGRKTELKLWALDIPKEGHAGRATDSRAAVPTTSVELAAPSS